MKLLIQGIILSLSFIAASGACGGDFTALKGKFSSPKYPKTYPNNQKCTYTFNTGYPITITCKVFKLQRKKNGRCSMDFMKINDSGNKKAYCGNKGPKNYASTTSKVKVIFKSNKSQRKKGFKCSYKSIVENTTSALLQTALDLYNSNTCYTGTRRICGCTVTKDDSEFYTTTSGSYRIVATNGIPSHDYEDDQEQPNPNNACPHEVFMAIPLKPTKGDTYTVYGLGTVGFAISGAFFYNHLATPDGDVAVVAEAVSFDSCKGHSDKTCSYHYHMLPVCIAGEGTCTFVGYMQDGFSIYTYCTHETESRYLKSCYYLTTGKDGSMASDYTFNQTSYDNGACDLDKANGYTFSDQRGYSYIFTEDYPFIASGYYGTEVGNICYMEEDDMIPNNVSL